MKLSKSIPAAKIWSPTAGHKFGAMLFLNELGDNTSNIGTIYGDTKKEAEARRAFIVLACNSHASLVADHAAHLARIAVHEASNENAADAFDFILSLLPDKYRPISSRADLQEMREACIRGAKQARSALAQGGKA